MFSPGPIRKYIRNKGNGAEGAEDFLARQISRWKNLAGFLKTVRKIWWEFLVTKFVHQNLSWQNFTPLVCKEKFNNLQTGWGKICPEPRKLGKKNTDPKFRAGLSQRSSSGREDFPFSVFSSPRLGK